MKVGGASGRDRENPEDGKEWERPLRREPVRTTEGPPTLGKRPKVLHIVSTKAYNENESKKPNVMLKTVEKVLLLQELEVFREATSEQLARLAIISTDRSFVEKEILFEKGDICASLQVLVDGKVQLGPPGKGFVVESTILDPLSFFARQPHNTAAAALASGILLETPHHDLSDLLTSEGEFGWIVLKEIARIGRQLMNQQMLELV